MHDLALCITNRCPLRCSFCCVPPGPGDLDEASIAKVIGDVVAEKARWKSVGFTGGEPLLRYEAVCDAGAVLKSHGIPWGITTGLGWCSNRTRALIVAGRLAEAGISSVNVSFDPSHYEHLKTAFFKDFLRALSDAAVPMIISCTLFKDQEMPNEEIARMTGLNVSSIFVERHYVAKTGLAKDRTDCSTAKFNFAKSKCPMQSELTLSVWPDGSVYPCCSTYVVNKEKSLAVGNVKFNTINEIADTAEADAYLAFIRRAGFSSLIAAFADNIHSLKDVFDEYPQDTCHLCAKLISKTDMRALRSAIIAKGFALETTPRHRTNVASTPIMEGIGSGIPMI